MGWCWMYHHSLSLSLERVVPLEGDSMILLDWPQALLWVSELRVHLQILSRPQLHDMGAFVKHSHHYIMSIDPTELCRTAHLDGSTVHMCPVERVTWPWEGCFHSPHSFPYVHWGEHDALGFAPHSSIHDVSVTWWNGSNHIMSLRVQPGNWCPCTSVFVKPLPCMFFVTIISQQWRSQWLNQSRCRILFLRRVHWYHQLTPSTGCNSFE